MVDKLADDSLGFLCALELLLGAVDFELQLSDALFL